MEILKATKSGRLDAYLGENFKDITRSQIKNQIEKGRVQVNGVVVTKSGKTLHAGDEIAVDFILEEPIENLEPENIPLDIVYEDDSIAVINKPRGMTVHPAVGNAEHTLANAILYHFDTASDINGLVRPGIVHRIDKDTTGLLVVAKNNAAHINLAAQIAEHSARRTYIALVEGNWKQDQGTIETDIGRDKRDRKKMAVVDAGCGKHAITHFKVLKRYDGFSLVQFKLETGRTHQIRVHAAHAGHPIVGDEVYGFKKQKFKLGGQLLHATELELVHPKTGQAMKFFAPLPTDFENVLKKLKEI